MPFSLAQSWFLKKTVAEKCVYPFKKLEGDIGFGNNYELLLICDLDKYGISR